MCVLVEASAAACLDAELLEDVSLIPSCRGDESNRRRAALSPGGALLQHSASQRNRHKHSSNISVHTCISSYQENDARRPSVKQFGPLWTETE